MVRSVLLCRAAGLIGLVGLAAVLAVSANAGGAGAGGIVLGLLPILILGVLQTRKPDSDLGIVLVLLVAVVAWTMPPMHWAVGAVAALLLGTAHVSWALAAQLPNAVVMTAPAKRAITVGALTVAAASLVLMAAAGLVVAVLPYGLLGGAVMSAAALALLGLAVWVQPVGK